MLTNIIEELNAKNFSDLQNRINDEANSEFYISALNLYIWKYYNIRVFFEITNDAIYLYSFYEGGKELYIFKPIIKKDLEIKIKDYYKQAILNVQLRVRSYEKLHFITDNISDLDLFKNPVVLKKFNVSYLYETNQLKYMTGKKMQKKRNFVNFFKKTYESKTKIIKYSDSYYDKVIEFCKNHSVDSENGYVRENEIDSIKELLKLNLPNGSGSILFYEDEIIGFTFGVINKDKYEIFVEKANSHFKGSYQYLLLSNLQLNEIDTKYIDRQDDLDNPMLEKSKKSYNPIKIHTLTFFEVNNAV